jgi:hypothetical protein
VKREVKEGEEDGRRAKLARGQICIVAEAARGRYATFVYFTGRKIHEK